MGGDLQAALAVLVYFPILSALSHFCRLPHPLLIVSKLHGMEGAGTDQVCWLPELCSAAEGQGVLAGHDERRDFVFLIRADHDTDGIGFGGHPKFQTRAWISILPHSDLHTLHHEYCSGGIHFPAAVESKIWFG